MAKIPKLLYCEDLFNLWGVNDVTLTRYVLYHELPAYHPDSMEPVDIEKEIEHRKNVPHLQQQYGEDFQQEFFSALQGRIAMYVFKEDELISFAKKNDLPLPSEKATGPEIVEDQEGVEQETRDEEVPQEVVELIREIKPKMESLYNDLKERVGFDYDNRRELEKEAICWLNDQDDQVIKNVFKKDYFKDQKIYSTNPEQIPWDFIGPLLKKIVKDQLKKKIGGQRLYEIYKEI